MKTLRRLVGLVALAVAVAPACAGASMTQWYDEGLPIAEGRANAVSIGSSGKLTLSLKRPHMPLINVKCVAEGVEKVWNEPLEGRDEALSIAFHSCEPGTTASAEMCPTPSATAVALPWPSRLFGEEHPLFDEWSGVELDFACGSTDYGVFSGTLLPNQGDADEQCEGGGDDLDNELRFQPGNTRMPRPRLHGAAGEIGFVGAYKLGTKGHGITGEVFPCKSREVGK